MRPSVLYTLLFSAAVCVVCAVLVSAAAVTPQGRAGDQQGPGPQGNVLEAAGLKDADEKLPAEEVESRFASIEAVFVDLQTGEEVEGGDPNAFDQQKAKKDPATQPPRRPRICRG